MPITYGNNTLYLAWQGPDEHLYVASSSDGKAFVNKHALAEVSLKSTRPAIAYGKNLVFLAWIDHKDEINILTSPDGLYWSNKRTIAEKAHRKAPPAMAYLNDRLYLAWAGTDHKDHLNITSFTVADDGELAEFAKITLDEESANDAGPALATDGKLLYLVWQGSDDHINVVDTENGKNFQNKRTLKEKSPHTATPGIVAGDGYLYLSWIGHDDHLNLLSSTDGMTWENKITLKDKSDSIGVSSLAYGNGTLFLDWTARERKHHIDVESFAVADTHGVITEGVKVVLEEEEEK